MGGSTWLCLGMTTLSLSCADCLEICERQNLEVNCQDNKLKKLLHLVGDLFELYDDARTYKL
jgi:hypothetical protein